MHPVVLVLIPFSLLLASCEVRFDWPWNQPQAQGDEAQGVLTEDRTIRDFQRVSLEGMGQLVLDPTLPKGTVRITANASLLASVRVSVSSNTLVLKEEGVRMPGDELEYRVAPPAGLDRITLAGMGSVTATEPLTTGNLELGLEGLGRLDLEVTAQKVLVTQVGQGEVIVRGRAQRVEVRAEGLGRVDLSGLETPEASVESEGIGEVRVFASEKLRVRANGMGAVRFSGNPAQTDVQTEGLTQVEAE